MQHLLPTLRSNQQQQWLKLWITAVGFGQVHTTLLNSCNRRERWVQHVGSRNSLMNLVPPPFNEFLFPSFVTELINNSTSSSRSIFNELHRDICWFFSCPAPLKVELPCKIATQMEKACNGDRFAWKSTAYCPSSTIVMPKVGVLSLAPYAPEGEISTLKTNQNLINEAC